MARLLPLGPANFAMTWAWVRKMHPLFAVSCMLELETASNANLPFLGRARHQILNPLAGLVFEGGIQKFCGLDPIQPEGSEIQTFLAPCCHVPD